MNLSEKQFVSVPLKVQRKGPTGWGERKNMKKVREEDWKPLM